MRNRVAEFVGPESLALAGQMLLDTPSLDMAVIRDLVKPSETQHWRVLGNNQDIDTVTSPFYDLLKPLHDLDEVVAGWGEQHAEDLHAVTEKLRLLPGVQLAFTNARQAPVHFDIPKREKTILDGPLTLSVRTDHDSISRMFYARGFEGALDDVSSMIIDYGCQNDGRFPPDSRLNDLALDDFSRTQQGCGDGILIRNHPNATAHATTNDYSEGSDRRITTATILAYGFEILGIAK